MNTRNVEKYKVLKANTERLKKSAIIDMQNKLNEDWHENLRQKKDKKNENGEFLCWLSCGYTLSLCLHYITLINLSLSLSLSSFLKQENAST